MTGVAVNTSVYSGDINTSAIWLEPPPELVGKINVTPEMGDVVALATMYLGGQPCSEDTELLKKVGGFRIGTYPDFETAFETSGKKSEGAVSYLHRLTPYASAVCASTTGFGISPGKGKNATEVINPENMGDPKNASHVAYELRPLLEAVLSVGYDGPLALDYRGPGDVAAGLALSRSTILSALGADEDDDDDLDDLMDELEAEDAPDAEESEP